MTDAANTAPSLPADPPATDRSPQLEHTAPETTPTPRAKITLRKSRLTGRPTGRPKGSNTYTPEIGASVLSQMAEGKSLRQIHREGGPPPSTVIGWGAQIEGFSEQYARATEHRAHALFDKLDAIAQDVQDGELASDKARVVADIYKWQLSKMMPAVYGDRSQVEIGGKLATEDQTPRDVAPEWLAPKLDKPPANDAAPAAQPAALAAGIAAKMGGK